MNSLNNFPKNFHSWVPNQNLSELNADYIDSIKKQFNILLPLFVCAINDNDFWSNQTIEIKKNIIISIYKFQPHHLKLAKKIPNIYQDIKKVVKHYKYTASLKKAVKFINNKANKNLLDSSKISQIIEDRPSLLSLLTTKDNYINELAPILESIKFEEISLEILPHLLKLALECDETFCIDLIKNNHLFFRKLINKNDTKNETNIRNLNSKEILITIEHYYKDINFNVKYLIEFFDYLNFDIKIEFNFLLSVKKQINNDYITFIRKFKNKVKKINITNDPQETDINFLIINANIPLLNKLKFLIKSGVFEEIEELNFKYCIGLITLPEEIGLLNNLKTLSVLDLVMPYVGLKIPKEIGKLTKLEKLSIRLSSEQELPKEIEKLTELKTLCLSLPQMPPFSLSQFKKLEFLELNIPNLDYLPEEIWSLSAIKELYIKSQDLPNKYFEVSLNQVLRLKKLESLSLPITIQDRLKIFFSFSGKIKKLIELNIPLNALNTLIKNREFYSDEQKNHGLTLSLLLVEIEKLVENKNSEQMLVLDQFSQDLAGLLFSIFDIKDKTWITENLSNQNLSYQTRLKRLKWLSDFLARSSIKSNPLLDERTYPTLKAIWCLKDPSIQENATKILLSFYQPENEQKLKAWLSNLSLKSWQILPYLFLTKAEISEILRGSILKGLADCYYQDSKKIQPIIEVLHLLEAPYPESSSPAYCESKYDLTREDFENILQLILMPIEPLENKRRDEIKAEFEKSKTIFFAEQQAFREKQVKCINMIKGIISTRRISYLKGLKTEEILFERMKIVSQEVFGVDENTAIALLNVFNSERYPNALFTYVSNTYFLPIDETEPLMQRMKKFIEDVIEGKFPESRYCISADDPNNLHLNTIFRMQDGKINQRLLEEWKSSFVIPINSSENLNAKSSTPPHQLVKNGILHSLRNNHLGTNFKEQYPRLYLVQKGKDIKIIKSILKHAELKLSKQNLTEEEKKFLNIEIKCLELLALEEQCPLSFIISALMDLKENTAHTQFSQDLEDIKNLLQPKDSRIQFVSIEDTNDWEDWLLMGTEVRNSRQAITAEPYFKKALLSYITDGKHKLIIVRDSVGKIAARCVLRILWDNIEKKPALCMSPLYARYNHTNLKEYITTGCQEKAKRMGLRLYALHLTDKSYNNSLYSLSCLRSPNPYECLEEGLGVISTASSYTLEKKLSLIYTPPSCNILN